MSKFLIVIVLLVTGIKFTCSCDVFKYTICDFAELTLKGEESEQEKKQEKSKNDDQDNILQHYVISPLLNALANFLKIWWQQDAYPDFSNSPNTPPPDMV